MKEVTFGIASLFLMQFPQSTFAMGPGKFENLSLKKSHLSKLSSLPTEVIQEISKYLNQTDYCAFAGTSQKTRQMLTDLKYLKTLRQLRDDVLGKKISYRQFKKIHKIYHSDALNIRFENA